MRGGRHCREDAEARLRWISFFLVGYVEEKLWWSIQSPNIGRKKKASS